MIPGVGKGERILNNLGIGLPEGYSHDLVGVTNACIDGKIPEEKYFAYLDEFCTYSVRDWFLDMGSDLSKKAKDYACSPVAIEFKKLFI
jgi:hypothetical protein